jgi:3-hydroxyisobutyrate dehydrogenase-like beta-hydroxyacid dehydrogenase
MSPARSGMALRLSRIALIGFGEVGQILTEDLAAAGVGEIAAYDILFADPESIPSLAAARLPVRATASGAEAARGAELIFSAVTAAQDHAAAESVVAGIEPGAFYLDLNSCSPGQKRASAATIEAAGGRYVEGAVMTPFPPKRIASPTLLGGPHAEAFLAAAEGLGLSAQVFSLEIGQASATKMCRSVIIKGIEALLAESMLAARRYGVQEAVLVSLSDLLPVGDWPKLARYMISRSLEHGTRRAEEMREVAVTVSEAGIQPLMSASCAERQDWAAGHKPALGEAELGDMLDAILARVDAAQATRI